MNLNNITPTLTSDEKAFPFKAQNFVVNCKKGSPVRCELLLLLSGVEPRVYVGLNLLVVKKNYFDWLITVSYQPIASSLSILKRN